MCGRWKGDVDEVFQTFLLALKLRGGVIMLVNGGVQVVVCKKTVKRYNSGLGTNNAL